MYIYPVTPQELKDNSVAPRDIFQETLGDISTNSQINTMLVKQAWARFRRRPIGDKDVDYFVQCLQDRIDYNWLWYSRVIEILIDNGILSLLDSESNITITNNSENISVNESHITGNSQLTHEKLPATPVSGLKYLETKDNNDNESDGNTTNTITDESTNTTVQNGANGLKVERLLKLMNTLKEINDKFMDELDPLFMNRW